MANRYSTLRVCMSEPHLHTGSHTNTHAHTVYVPRSTLFLSVCFMTVLAITWATSADCLDSAPYLCIYQTTGNTIQYMSILVQCSVQLHPCTPTHNCSSTTCTCSVANPLLLCQRAYLLQPADGLLTVSCSCTRLSKRHTRKKQQSTCSW